MTVEYSEREARPDEADRGRVLDALAGEGTLWAFLKVSFPAPGEIALGIEQHDGMSVAELRGLLTRILQALPPAQIDLYAGEGSEDDE